MPSDKSLDTAGVPEPITEEYVRAALAEHVIKDEIKFPTDEAITLFTGGMNNLRLNVATQLVERQRSNAINDFEKAIADAQRALIECLKSISPNDKQGHHIIERTAKHLSRVRASFNLKDKYRAQYSKRKMWANILEHINVSYQFLMISSNPAIKNKYSRTTSFAKFVAAIAPAITGEQGTTPAAIELEMGRKKHI
jgi:hypothetical protein